MQAAGEDPANYQAILTLPSSTEGMEKLFVQDDYWIRISALPYSYQSGLPLTTCIMSRGSIGNTLGVLQLSNGVYGQKDILNELKSDKPFLAMIPNKHLDEFSDLLSADKLINKNEQISLYRLDITDLKHKTLSNEQAGMLRSNFSLKPDLSQRTSFFENFEQFENEMGLMSNSSFYLEDGKGEVVSIECSGFDRKSELSFWHKMLADDSTVPSFELHQLDEKDGFLEVKYFRDWDFKRFEVFDNWVRYLVKMDLNPKTARIKLVVLGEHVYLDRLLLKSEKGNKFLPTNRKDYIQLNHNLVKLAQ